MCVLQTDRDAGIDLVMNTLKDNKYGLSIAEISRKSGMNRNSVAKYLNILVTLGQVEMQIVGPARVYHLSPRMPISPAFFSFLPDPAVLIAENGEILKVNRLFIEYFSLYARAVIGKKSGKHPWTFSMRWKSCRHIRRPEAGRFQMSGDGYRWIRDQGDICCGLCRPCFSTDGPA